MHLLERVAVVGHLLHNHEWIAAFQLWISKTEVGSGRGSKEVQISVSDLIIRKLCPHKLSTNWPAAPGRGKKLWTLLVKTGGSKVFEVDIPSGQQVTRIQLGRNPLHRFYWAILGQSCEVLVNLCNSLLEERQQVPTKQSALNVSP